MPSLVSNCSLRSRSARTSCLLSSCFTTSTTTKQTRGEVNASTKKYHGNAESDPGSSDRARYKTITRKPAATPHTQILFLCHGFSALTVLVRKTNPAERTRVHNINCDIIKELADVLAGPEYAFRASHRMIDFVHVLIRFGSNFATRGPREVRYANCDATAGGTALSMAWRNILLPSPSANTTDLSFLGGTRFIESPSASDIDKMTPIEGNSNCK